MFTLHTILYYYQLGNKTSCYQESWAFICMQLHVSEWCSATINFIEYVTASKYITWEHSVTKTSTNHTIYYWVLSYFFSLGLYFAVGHSISIGFWSTQKNLEFDLTFSVLLLYSFSNSMRTTKISHSSQTIFTFLTGMVIYSTPHRTHRISGLKYQVLKPTFLA